MSRDARLVFLRNPPGPDAHINDFLEGWYEAMRDSGLPEERVPNWPGRRITSSALSRLLPQRPLPWATVVALTPLSWASDRDIYPTAFRHRIVPWIYDCWPSHWDRWEALLRRLRVRMAFFSSRSAAREFARRLPALRCEWVPEAVNPSRYDPTCPLSARRIDLLELGRLSPSIHERLQPVLAERDLRHEYQRPGTARLYPGQRALRDALARTRLLVCLPKSITHPDAAGGLETVTYRYFEGIASGCVLIGHCPAELLELWGFDPVVPIDPSRPERSVLDALDRIDELQDLADRNLRRLQEVGTWRHRAAAMIAAAEAPGA